MVGIIAGVHLNRTHGKPDYRVAGFDGDDVCRFRDELNILRT